MSVFAFVFTAPLLATSLALGAPAGDRPPGPWQDQPQADAPAGTGGRPVADASASGWSPGDDHFAPGDHSKLNLAPPARPFRRSGMGLLLELGAGSAVAVSSGLLIDHPPGWLHLTGPSGLLAAISVISLMAVGSAAAVGATAYATDGPSGSPVHDAVGLGLGSLLGFGLAAGAVDSAVGTTSPTPSSALVLLGVPLGAVVGYNLTADADAMLPGSSTRLARKLSLCLVFGGNTLGGAGLDLGFQLADRFAVALQGIDGDLGGAEGSARLRGYLLTTHRSALYLSGGLHLTTGVSRATQLALQTSAAAATGAVASLGAEFRGESGIMLAVELSGAYEPRASAIANTGHGPFYPGGAFLLGYAR